MRGERLATLGRLHEGGHHRGEVAVREGGRPGGFGVLRRCVSGWKLGPLLAGGSAAAADLLADLAADAPGEPLMLDVPEPNAAGLGLARRAGLEPVFETARMWTGPPPEAEPGHVFGVATLELG